MRKFVVQVNDADQRVDKFLQKTIPLLPKSLMYKSIRNKKIKVNNKRCEISQRLQENDEVICFIAEEFFEHIKDKTFMKASTKLDVVYEDENIIIMNKEVGLLVHSDDSENVDCLVNRMKHYLYKKGEYDYETELSFAPALCHRIDRNTQGMVIGAKNAMSLRCINEAIRDNGITKKYICIVEGEMIHKQETVVAYHKKENEQVFISMVEKLGYKEIITKYKVLEVKHSYSLLEIELITGKSHQIRALMAKLRRPLYGDTKYHAKKQKYPYQALCAYELEMKALPLSLEYLNGKKFKIHNIDFLSIFHR